MLLQVIKQTAWNCNKLHWAGINCKQFADIIFHCLLDCNITYCCCYDIKTHRCAMKLLANPTNCNELVPTASSLLTSFFVCFIAIDFIVVVMIYRLIDVQWNCLQIQQTAMSWYQPQAVCWHDFLFVWLQYNWLLLWWCFVPKWTGDWLFWKRVILVVVFQEGSPR